MMNILILSMTVGQGHNSASRAIKHYMDTKGHNCEILDTYKFLNKAIGAAFDKGYTAMGRFWPSLNENIYEAAKKYNGRADMKMYFPWIFADMTKAKMQKYIEDTKPDVIVCSIVMSAILVTLLKESAAINPNIKTIGIVTDYSLHPFWEYTEMDYFVCPNELMIPSMKKRGIAESKILPIGIPIDGKFSKVTDKDVARQKLQLDPNQFTVLVSAGGMGFSGMIDATKDMDEIEDIQIVAACGTNKRLCARMQEISFKNTVHVLEFVENMNEYLDACDIFVTKPGGLSTSEAIAKRVPMILTSPMPGVENMNLPFLVNNSLAVQANKYQPISEVILQMKHNSGKIEEMKIAQTRWGKVESAKALGDFMERLV